jgi:hypothetical protein
MVNVLSCFFDMRLFGKTKCTQYYIPAPPAAGYCDMHALLLAAKSGL